MTTKTCTIEGCTGEHQAHGLCGKHYSRLRTFGTTDLPPRPPQRKKGQPTLTCERCGVVFTRKRVRGSPRFCSQACWNVRNYDESVALFWGKVDRARGDDACWLWMGHLDAPGYGRATFQGRSDRAHRIAWRLVNGAITPGFFVCHRCDNPRCVNPSHLFLGTPGENARDRNAKGRAARKAGTKNGRARLTERGVIVVREMAAKGMTPRAIGEFFGLHPTTVRYAINGKHWAPTT